jgi:hypothetical protein
MPEHPLFGSSACKSPQLIPELSELGDDPQATPRKHHWDGFIRWGRELGSIEAGSAGVSLEIGRSLCERSPLLGGRSDVGRLGPRTGKVPTLKDGFFTRVVNIRRLHQGKET